MQRLLDVLGYAMKIHRITLYRETDQCPYTAEIMRIPPGYLEGRSLIVEIRNYTLRKSTLATLLTVVNQLCEVKHIDQNPNTGHFTATFIVIDPNTIKICPRCHVEYKEHPALSRRDNRTSICPKCGIEEALVDAAGKNAYGTAMWARDVNFVSQLEKNK